jgi:hypothetical protein
MVEGLFSRWKNPSTTLRAVPSPGNPGEDLEGLEPEKSSPKSPPSDDQFAVSGLYPRGAMRSLPPLLMMLLKRRTLT